MYEIGVTHSIDAGHRVVGHEDGKGKCARLHGHTYVFDVTLWGPSLDEIGFVTDFGVVKAALDEWDHRMILWDNDGLDFSRNWTLAEREAYMEAVNEPDKESSSRYLDKFNARVELELGVVRVPFNPTAENMALHFADRFADLDGVAGATVEVRETPKTVARFTTLSPEPVS